MNRYVHRLSAMLLVAIIVLIFGCAGVGPSGDDSPHVRVTVLFFNDLHGHLSPFEIKDGDGTREVGGIARIATIVGAIRAENAKKKIHTLVLVAGDILQGTPMSTVFKGEPDIKCLNALGVDALTVGNHEFDFGLQNFLDIRQQAAFPFLSANIIAKNTGRKICRPGITIPLADGADLTIIGVTTRYLLHTTKADNVAALDVLDPVASAVPLYERSKKLGPVILLSHSRHVTDRALARAMPGLAAIIGGHDQILLSPYRKEGAVPIFQAFEKGRYLGRIDLDIDPATRKAALVAADYIPITAAIRPHPGVAKIVAAYEKRLGRQFKTVIGRSAVYLDGEREHVRYRETPLGNFIADIMRAHTGTQVALINSGGLRASIRKGPVTVADVFKAMPYANELVVVELSGTELLQVLTRAAEGARGDEDGGFLQVSGIAFEIRGHQVQNVSIGKEKQALDPARKYTVAVPDFLASGGDDHTVFKGKPSIKTGLPLRELIVDTVKQQKVISAEVEGRIVRLP